LPVGGRVDVLLVSIEYFSCLTSEGAINEDGNLMYEDLVGNDYHHREWTEQHGEYQAIYHMEFIEWDKVSGKLFNPRETNSKIGRG
jgi:hypothetical protein